MSLDLFVAALRAGQVVACPTETQMGLLADALDPAAVQRVCDLKQRPHGEPIGVVAPDVDSALALAVRVSDRARALAEQHWPGPLTLVMSARPGLPTALVQGGTIGVRVPGPSPALDLLRAFGGPLTATSANLSGEPVCQDSDRVAEVFGLDLASVPGRPPGGPPSTVLDVTGALPRVLRQGALQLLLD